MTFAEMSAMPGTNLTHLAGMAMPGEPVPSRARYDRYWIPHRALSFALGHLEDAVRH